MYIKNALVLVADQLLKFRRTIKISAVGNSNSMMRTGYCSYFSTYISEITSRPTSLKNYSLGGVTSIYGAMQQDKYNIAASSDIILFEFCINDRHFIEEGQYSLDLAGKALEGFIRKVKKANPTCIVIVLIFGVNLEKFYVAPCPLLELYKFISEKYNLPVITLTKLLSEAHGLDYIKTLYNEKDHAHFTRPQGVQVVAQAIANELNEMGVLEDLKRYRKQYQAADIPAIYSNNFEDLTYFDRFENGNFFAKRPNISTFVNTAVRAKCFSIFQGNSLDFQLKGRLIGILIKSDKSDGFISIKFNDQRIVTSSYSAWIKNTKPRNVINLMALPLLRFSESSDFAPASISLCSEYPQDFELEVFKVAPAKLDPEKWKLSIIGVVYIGELKPQNCS